MLNHERSFLAAIDADPLDDTRRLIYADWLDEQGESAAAELLRAELALAHASSGEAAALRERLWRAWAAIDRRRLHEFTQPHRMRANPTRYEPRWDYNLSCGFPNVDGDCDGDPRYSALPPLPLSELRGEFQYITSDPQAYYDPCTRELQATRHNEGMETTVDLPAEYSACLTRTVPDAWTYFYLPGFDFLRPEQLELQRDEQTGATLVEFFFYLPKHRRSLYLHPSGAHCIIGEVDEKPYFIAPSFEAFFYRMWIEVGITLRRDGPMSDDPEDRPPMTPEMEAYLAHFERHRPRV